MEVRRISAGGAVLLNPRRKTPWRITSVNYIHYDNERRACTLLSEVRATHPHESGIHRERVPLILRTSD